MGQVDVEVQINYDNGLVSTFDGDFSSDNSGLGSTVMSVPIFIGLEEND